MSAPTAPRRGQTRPLSLAPMMDRTDRHFRVLCRLISRHTLLYTEMVVADAALHGVRERVLGYTPIEHPVALQLGGDDPLKLALAARIAEDLGYDEVNLNVGCPSERVQQGNFGACLMLEPATVAAAVSAMRTACGLPITVKHRIGVDDHDDYPHMLRFVDVVAEAGCDRFSVHARKAWLSGLSPRENRTIPPLRYDEVYRLKVERPHLIIEVNGGIDDLDAAEPHLQHVDAVMIGRGLWDRPMRLAQADQRLFGDAHPARTTPEVVTAYADYVDDRLRLGDRFSWLARPVLNLFAGQPGTKRWKHAIAELIAAGPHTPQALIAAIPEAS